MYISQQLFLDKSSHFVQRIGHKPALIKWQLHTFIPTGCFFFLPWRKLYRDSFLFYSFFFFKAHLQCINRQQTHRPVCYISNKHHQTGRGVSEKEWLLYGFVIRASCGWPCGLCAGSMLLEEEFFFFFLPGRSWRAHCKSSSLATAAFVKRLEQANASE